MLDIMSAVDGRATIDYFVGNDQLRRRPNRKSSARREQTSKQANKQTKHRSRARRADRAAAGAVDQPAPARRLHARPADGRDAPPRRRQHGRLGQGPSASGYSPNLPSAAVRRLLRAYMCIKKDDAGHKIPRRTVAVTPAVLYSAALSRTRPAVSGTRRALSGTRRALSGTRPAPSGTRPALSGTRPAVSGTRPALSGTRRDRTCVV